MAVVTRALLNMNLKNPFYFREKCFLSFTPLVSGDCLPLEEEVDHGDVPLEGVVLCPPAEGGGEEGVGGAEAAGRARQVEGFGGVGAKLLKYTGKLLQ